MGEELAAIIRAEIQTKGPIDFSRWMQLCLYHPQYGYYMKPGRKTGTGRDADFVTPPTLHPFFGKAMGEEIAEAWEIAGSPATFTVLEFGGGEGDLSLAALARMDGVNPLLSKAIKWVHCEESPTHGALQKQKCLDSRFQWVEPGAPAMADVLLMCEVLDCEPFDLYERRPNEWREIRVGVHDGLFVEVAGRHGFPDAVYREGDEGQRRPWIPYDGRLHDDIEDHLKMPGCVLLCDYGGRGAGFVPGVRAFKQHGQVELVRQDPGDYDITMDVEFPRRGDSRYETMEAFLLRHGILDELNSIDRSTVEGASSYLRLRQLLLPTGMGAAFKVARFDRIKP